MTRRSLLDFRPLPSGVEDLVGRTVGKLTVIGFFHKICPARNNLWTVRCTCGNVEVRQQRWIKNEKKDGRDCCAECRFKK